MNDEALLQQAYKFHRDGKWYEAEQAYREVLTRSPDSILAIYGLGVLAAQVGNDQRAVELIHETINRSPYHAEAYSNLGTILARNQRLMEARACIERSLTIDPNFASAWNNLGELQQKNGEFDRALQSLERSIQLDPQRVEAYNNLGVVYQRRHDHARALFYFSHAIAIQPSFYLAHYNQAVSYDALGAPQAAIQACHTGTKFCSNDAELWSLLGKLYLSQSKFQPALDALQQAIQHDPKCVKALLNLAMVYQSIGNHESALQAYRRAHALEPTSLDVTIGLVNQLQWSCDWEGLDTLCTMVIDNVDKNPTQLRDAFVPPFWFLSLAKPTSSRQQLTVAQAWSERIRQVDQPLTRPKIERDSKRLIRIGYLSADFGDHATTWLIGDLFACHDRNHFEIYGYSFQRGPSHERQRIEQSCDVFSDITSLTHSEAAAKIQEDRIDILVDLKGYTQNARPEILAMRPAPIQVAYLGYPGTMGASFIDFVIVDDFVVPSDRQPFYTERLVALPGCYQVNVPASEVGIAPQDRASHGLPTDGLVFCAFNNPFKITPMMFDVWMRLLHRVPRSALWMLGDNTAMKTNLRREATRRGIDEARLVFAPRVPHAQHLARHRLADIFLDTFPYNAHTTASDALRMGVPVVTMVGEAFASRVAGSLLRALGLMECVTDNLIDYEEVAANIAVQKHRREELQSRLQAGLRSSDLYNSKAFALKLETAFRAMRSQSCSLQQL